MSKNYTETELKNMTVQTFKSQLGNKSYVDFIQYLVKKYKKVKLAEMSLFFLDSLSEEHELCRQSIGHEIESLNYTFWEYSSEEVFDLINSRLKIWDEMCKDSQIIDMFQAISFLYAANCYIHKGFRKSIGVKTGFFS